MTHFEAAMLRAEGVISAKASKPLVIVSANPSFVAEVKRLMREAADAALSEAK